MQERESPGLLCYCASSCEEHSNFILSCNLIGQRENKSFYVTEIVFWLGFAGVIFGGTSDRRKYVCVRWLPIRPCGKNYISGHIWHKSFIKTVKCSFFNQIIVNQSFYGALLTFRYFLLQGKVLCCVGKSLARYLSSSVYTAFRPCGKKVYLRLHLT